MHLTGWMVTLLNTPELQALGWALLQFLWQGTLIAAIAAVGLLLLRRQARARYALGVGSMLLMLLTFLATLMVSWKAPQFAQRASTGLPWNAAAIEMQSWGSALLHGILGGWVSNSGMQRGLAWITVLWGCGVLWFQARLLVQWKQVDQLRRTASSADSSPLSAMVQELAERLRLRQTVRVLETTTLQVPAVVGWFDPIVLVPSGILGHLSADQLRAVLAHELAHLRRYDHLVNLVQCVTESLLFFHPAVWWLSNQIREDREYCCDDVAVEICGDVLAYARALQDMEERRAGEEMSRNGFGVPQAILAATGGSLMDRITRLFGVQPTSRRSMGRWAVPGLMVVLVATAMLAASCEPNLVQEPTETSASQMDQMASNPQADQPANAMNEWGAEGVVELHADHVQEGLKAAMGKLGRAREHGDITEGEYQQQIKSLHEAFSGLQAGESVAVPFGKGGHFIVREGDEGSFEARVKTKQELHELLGSGGELHELKGGGLHWVSEDGTELDNEFFEKHADAIVEFKKETAEQAKSGEPKQVQ